MNRFDREGVRRSRASDAVKASLVLAVVLIAFSGGSIRDAGEEMEPGIERDIVLAIGAPAGWIADHTPLADAGHEVTAGLNPDNELGSGGFETEATTESAAEVPPVTEDAFDPIAIGVEPETAGELETMLVTGDSLSTPLDQELARRLAPEGVEVIRDPHLATGISKASLVDWGQLATSQVDEDAPDAVVMFLGANEGFPMEGADGQEVECCGADWAAIYSSRARQMANTYRQNGAARVYWLTLPLPRDEARQEIAKVVNQGIDVAVQPWRSQIDVLEMDPIFAPDGEYTDSIDVDGESTIVRESDGIHLNDVGSAIAADEVIEAVDQDFAPQPTAP
ncbi:MAG: hypothetical protein ACR2OC_09540 [Solirubrobacterales bacterium]